MSHHTINTDNKQALADALIKIEELHSEIIKLTESEADAWNNFRYKSTELLNTQLKLNEKEQCILEMRAALRAMIEGHDRAQDTASIVLQRWPE